MNTKVSKELKRYNYLFGETGAAYHQLYRRLGQSDSSISILYILLENDGSCLLQKICNYTGLSKQTVNSALRKLEQEEVLYLEAADSKHKIVHLTEKGMKLANKTAGKVIEIENDIFASWPRETLEQYISLTEKYLLSLKERLNYEEKHNTTI